MIIVFIVACLGLSAAAQAQSFSYPEFKSFIQERDFKSPNEVFAALPEDFRKNFTLVARTRSLQRGTLELPRILMFGKDAKLVITFSGDPTAGAYQRIETMQFDESRSRFDFTSIEFSPHHDQSARFVENPSVCMNCHATRDSRHDPQPVWDSHPVWRGVYGGIDDVLENSSEELYHYKNFLQSASTHERYSKLLFDFNESPVFPYSPTPTSKLSLKPNFRLGLMLNRLNAKRVARQFQESALYQQNKKQILAELLGCRPAEISASFKTEIYAKVDKTYEQSGHTPPPSEDQAYKASLLQLAHAGVQAGLDIPSWFLVFEPNSYFMHDGSFHFAELVKTELMHKLAEEDSRIASFIEIEGITPDFPDQPETKSIDALGGKLTDRIREACPLL